MDKLENIHDISPIDSPQLSTKSSPISVRKDSFGTIRNSNTILKLPQCHVTVRIRPTFENEANKCVWNCMPNGSIEITTDFSNELSRKRKDCFYFDNSFLGSDNKALYELSVKSAIKEAMNGRSTTVFAYGQTASGKTFAMMGCDEQPGIIPQAIDDVFNLIRESSADREYLLRVSYMEIYNETIRDLLHPDQKELRIHENRNKGVYVSPLREEIVTNPKQVMKIIQEGEKNRHTSTTDYNLESSRSHTFFQMTIEASSRDSEMNSMFTVSQLNLIDLAGSERATADLDRRKEGAFINKSLLTLGTVISKITEEGSGHVPFRDSKLTRLLQPSLLGDARIIVIATISPTATNFEESLNTLQFAARVKKIIPKQDLEYQIDDKALLKRYRCEIEQLRLQLLETQSLLQKERSIGGGTLSDEERIKYEEQLEESRIVSTSLKERIDHLTKLILTASSMTAKPILDWNHRKSNEPRSSVMSATGMLPTQNRSLSGSLGNLSLDKRLSDQAFMQKHIQEIEKRDAKCKKLTQFISSFLHEVELPNSLLDKINTFMNENTLLFQNQVEPQQNINEITDKQKMKELVKTNKELEVVLQEHEETIQSLKSKLSDSLKLITFSEQDQLETEQVTKKQQSQIEHLQKELKGVMQEFQEYRQLSKKKREGINALDSKLLQTCVDAMKKAGGFDTQLAQIQKMVYYLESIENKSIQ